MIISDIVTRVQRQFGDESGVQVVEADILRWINDAQNEAALQHQGLLIATEEIPTVNGQQEYSYPASMIDVFSMRYKTSSTDPSWKNILAITPTELDQYINNWEGSDYLGEPVYYTKATKGKFKLFPVPDSSLFSVLVTFSRYPTDVVSAASIIDLPTYYHPYVLEYCLMKAYEMDEEWEAADRKAAYVQSTLDANAHREDWISKQTYPTITTAAGDL